MPDGSIPVYESPTEAARLRHDDVVPGLPAPENKKFYPALDGLRAVAVLMVFYQHYLTTGRYPAVNWGWSGVDFFFVLSGFLITGILYDSRNSPHRFRTFYVRRTLRIFPLYYGALLAGLLLTPYFHWKWYPSWLLWPLYLGNYIRFIWLRTWIPSGGMEHMLSTASFQHPFYLYFGHFWSLCVEEQFYLVWPLLVFFIRDRIRLRNFCLTVCVLCLAARILCVFLLPARYLDADILYRLTPLRADALLLGGAFALMLRGPEADKLKALVRPAFPFFLLGFALFEGLYRHAAHHFYYPTVGAPVLDTIGYSLLDLFAAIVIVLSLNPAGLFYRIFTIKPLRRLGQVSYGFYVFHDIPHQMYIALVDRTLGRYTTHITPAITVVAFCVTLALSFLSFRYFESPFLRLKERYAPVGSG